MKTTKKVYVCLVFCFLIGFSLVSAQSNDLLDDLLSQDPARLDTAVSLLLSASGHVSSEDSPAHALEKAKELRFVSSKALAEHSIRVDRLSFILMKSQELQGGIMYRIIPNPRFAYKHLVYLGFVSDSGGPSRLIAGDEVVRVLGYVLEHKGGTQ